jgi:hypothetical protein
MYFAPFPFVAGAAPQGGYMVQAQPIPYPNEPMVEPVPYQELSLKLRTQE